MLLLVFLHWDHSAPGTASCTVIIAHSAAGGTSTAAKTCSTVGYASARNGGINSHSFS